jgi:hypothetical protein
VCFLVVMVVFARKDDVVRAEEGRFFADGENATGSGLETLMVGSGKDAGSARLGLFRERATQSKQQIKSGTNQLSLLDGCR